MKMKLDQVKEGLLESCIKNGRTLIFDYISYDIPSDAELLFSSAKIQRKDG